MQLHFHTMKSINLTPLVSQISCKHLSHVWESMVGHESQPLEIELISQFLEPLVEWFFPELRIAQTKIEGSISLLVLFFILFFVLIFPFVQV
jgi:hypothetical protein